MIYRTFKEWKNGNYLEDLEPRKEAYTRDELLLIEMGWKYGFDAGVEAGRADEIEASASLGVYAKPLIEFARAIEAKLKEKNG